MPLWPLWLRESARTRAPCGMAPWGPAAPAAAAPYGIGSWHAAADRSAPIGRPPAHALPARDGGGVAGSGAAAAAAQRAESLRDGGSTMPAALRTSAVVMVGGTGVATAEPDGVMGVGVAAPSAAHA